jgi:chitinase
MNILFKKMENRKAKQVLSGGWHQWKGRGHKERGKEGKHGGILCTHVCKWKNETC